ncbi:Hypothetical protein ORPV_1121 [Orpheovirus IHUMI-LCC2]|uniref:Uncharacterized protein n=1 Tax=Orpheovirus IHUMI-LCC2 TaxID=2023057 RepID=A0A2I2L648_9VIRU|nr:Hypothetical protein ORPV_1121 [Orpheovirus IHUMI-LCC2]SNW63025.1 Hypothetical protein ORPV_1121 [Orpheovirus IHUMI-LCC2]
MTDCAKDFVTTFLKDINDSDSKLYNKIRSSIVKGYSGRYQNFDEYSERFPCVKRLSFEDQYYIKEEIGMNVSKSFKFDVNVSGFSVIWR